MKFLNNMTSTNLYEIEKQNDLNDFNKTLSLINWKANEEYTILTRVFYFKNVFYLTDFIKEIYNTDYSSNLQQIPNIHVLKKELFKIELTTPDLKGLSMKDLQLAFAINTINFQRFLMYPIKEEENYKREIRSISIYEQQEKENIQERTKLKNKYDALEYNKNINSNNFNKIEFDKLLNERIKFDSDEKPNLNFDLDIDKESFSREENKFEDINLNYNDSGCCSPGQTCACKQASKYKL